MSQLLINQYLNELSDLRRVSGTARETVVREAFKTLLKSWGRSCDLIFVPEYEYITPAKDRRLIDGALLHELRVPLGYWEAKDEKDDLDDEIEFKLRRGYPQDNIVFDDSHTAVLIQDKQEVIRCGVEDVAQLDKLLHRFFAYERPEIAEFRDAVAQFKVDLPAVLSALRDMIDKEEANNAVFRKAAAKFLKHARETINPSVTAADVREMLIQHILTEEIFSQVFDNADFHRQNNVAKELYALENTFFTGRVKHDTLAGLRSYYAAIKSAAALVSSHHEKQTFLKVIYENFYKVYNPKAADRLGVVYTPNEIVRFMVESADWLCQKHFGKALIDKQVEILDPAAGTGTFITELIEHFRGQPAKLRYKYLEELHANEVAILPYYVANLNIEASYATVNGYEEYPNLCFVDTLDNTAALKVQKNQHFGDLFGGVSAENVARIARQNKKKISVIIGNPPYNANQLNENQNNKNREYSEIDRRIKATYIAASTARKTKLYDMYARFFRWASDRVDQNGIVAFITNRSFVDSRTYDGFRKMVAEEFNEIYVLDLGGDVRVDPRLSGTKHNVFGIQTGVAISFMVKRAKAKGCRIRYARRPQMETAEDKLAYLGSAKMESMPFDEVRPDAKHYWINIAENDFDTLLPTASTEAKYARDNPAQEMAIFKLYTLGVVTARDDWVYDFDRKRLCEKVKYLVETYNSTLDRLGARGKDKDLSSMLGSAIKWTRAVKRDVANGVRYEFSDDRIVQANYRPFVAEWMYRDNHLNEMPNHTPMIFGDGTVRNRAIAIMGDSTGKPYFCLAIDRVPDYNFVSPASGGTQLLAMYRLDARGNRIDNITDWGLGKFCAQYEASKKPGRPITKTAIFHYLYGVLHDPNYREKYALNLKREFPRIPFYADFWRWAEWGETLMALHIDYETVEPCRSSASTRPTRNRAKPGSRPRRCSRPTRTLATSSLTARRR